MKKDVVPEKTLKLSFDGEVYYYLFMVLLSFYFTVGYFEDHFKLPTVIYAICVFWGLPYITIFTKKLIFIFIRRALNRAVNVKKAR